jgi:hypothetical protein
MCRFLAILSSTIYTISFTNVWPNFPALSPPSTKPPVSTTCPKQGPNANNDSDNDKQEEEKETSSCNKYTMIKQQQQQQHLLCLLFTSYTIKIRQNVQFQHQQFPVAFSKIYGCQHTYTKSSLPRFVHTYPKLNIQLVIYMYVGNSDTCMPLIIDLRVQQKWLTFCMAYVCWQRKHELATVSCLQMTSHGKWSIRCSTKQRHKQSQVS